MSDENALREKVRQAVHAGTLPNRRPERTWGGPGDGFECTICGAPVNGDEVELEIEFARDVDDPGQYRVHVRCFNVWELERQNLQRAEGAASSERPARSAIPASMARGSSGSR